MNCITWREARNFARWVGGDLLSEAEWEYTAKSAGKEKLFPWGNQFANCKRAVMSEMSKGCRKNSTWPVCSFTHGNTENGVCDMAGNVWEWTLDDYVSSYQNAPNDGRPVCGDP